VALTGCALETAAKQAVTFLLTFHEQATAMNKYSTKQYVSESEVSPPPKVGAAESRYHPLSTKSPLLNTVPRDSTLGTYLHCFLDLILLKYIMWNDS